MIGADAAVHTGARSVSDDGAFDLADRSIAFISHAQRDAFSPRISAVAQLYLVGRTSEYSELQERTLHARWMGSRRVAAMGALEHFAWGRAHRR